MLIKTITPQKLLLIVLLIRTYRLFVQYPTRTYYGGLTDSNDPAYFTVLILLLALRLF